MAKLGDPRDAWHNFGFVYGRSGASRGTTTSSGVFTVETGFSRQAVFAVGYDEGFPGRNNAADPSLTTGLGTFSEFFPLTPNGAQIRFRVSLNKTLSAASSVTTLTRSMTWATAITAVRCRWLAFGY